MPTNRKRINLALPDSMTVVLEKVAKRDNVPTATKVTELLSFALDIEEDMVLGAIVKERDTKDAVYVSHEEVWG